jgi:hypothetical protein
MPDKFFTLGGNMMTKGRIEGAYARSRIMYITLMIIVICGMILTPPVTMKVMAQGDKKPVAVIDGTFHVYINHTAYLDGSLSTGSDSVDYTWTLEHKPEGSLAMLEGSNESQAQFDADVVGTYRVSLVVTSGLTDSDPAYAIITVTEHPYMF